MTVTAAADRPAASGWSAVYDLTRGDGTTRFKPTRSAFSVEVKRRLARMTARVAMLATGPAGSGPSRGSAQDDQRRQDVDTAMIVQEEFEPSECLHRPAGAAFDEHNYDDDDSDLFTTFQRRRKNAPRDDDNAAAVEAAPEQPTHHHHHDAAPTPPMTFGEYWNARGSMVHSVITRGKTHAHSRWLFL